eukprot:2304833-Amphidinium_carterae.1
MLRGALWLSSCYRMKHMPPAAEASPGGAILSAASSFVCSSAVLLLTTVPVGGIDSFAGPAGSIRSTAVCICGAAPLTGAAPTSEPWAGGEG